MVPPARNARGNRHLILSNTGSKVVLLLYEESSEEGRSSVYRELDALWIINVPDNDNVSQTIRNTGIFLYREEKVFVFSLHFLVLISLFCNRSGIVLATHSVRSNWRLGQIMTLDSSLVSQWC